MVKFTVTVYLFINNKSLNSKNCSLKKATIIVTNECNSYPLGMVVFYMYSVSSINDVCSVCFSVHYVKRPGAVLDGGSVVAHLDLDDPSRVQQAQSFTGTLPQPQAPPTHGEKLHQLFQSTRAELENILAGYSLPEPYFRPKLQDSIERLMKCLRDPALPLLELQVNMHIYLAINSFSPFCTVPIKYQFFC